MAFALKDLFGSREPAPESKAEDSALNPELYFSKERTTDIEKSLRNLGSVSIVKVDYKNNAKQKTSQLEVEFDRDGKLYKATFKLQREKTESSYKMEVEVYSEHGKEIFTKTRENLDALQIPMAITFVFHEAFEKTS